MGVDDGKGSLEERRKNREITVKETSQYLGKFFEEKSGKLKEE